MSTTINVITMSYFLQVLPNKATALTLPGKNIANMS